MPENAIFFKLAYGAIATLFIAYAITLRLRRASIEQRRKQQGGA